MVCMQGTFGTFRKKALYNRLQVDDITLAIQKSQGFLRVSQGICTVYLYFRIVFLKIRETGNIIKAQV